MDSGRYFSSDEELPPRDGFRPNEASSSRSGSVSKSNNSHKSHPYSPDRTSPPYSKHKEERKSKEDKKYYDRHKSHRSGRSKDRYSQKYESRSRSRSRSKRSRSNSRVKCSRSRSRGKRSRSRSPRRSYRDYSPKRNIDYAERSPRRKHDTKSNKLSILEKMGIDLKVPENEKGGSSSILPSYYNPLVANPAKYAEQIAKRKLLWNNKKVNKDEGETVKNASIWQGAKFSQDQDGKMTAKFQRLMGMKEVPPKEVQTEQDGKVKDLFKKQEELFSSMEMQYEVARATTHTQRGVGLGFGPRHIP